MSALQISLGAGGIPASGADLVNRIRTTLEAFATSRAGGQLQHLLGADRLQATMSGTDIATFTVSLDGLELATLGQTIGQTEGVDARQEHPHARIDPLTTTTSAARLHEVHLTGDRVLVEGTAICLSAVLEQVPFEWISDANGTAAIRINPDTAGGLGTGRAVVQIPKASLAALLESTLSIAMREFEGTADEVAIAVEQPAVQQLDISGSARVKVRGLSARISIAAKLRIEAGHLICIDSVSLNSRNILVAGLLAIVRSAIEKATASPINVREHAPIAMRDLNAEVRVEGAQLFCELRFT